MSVSKQQNKRRRAKWKIEILTCLSASSETLLSGKYSNNNKNTQKRKQEHKQT
jgi:hypothetical protein